MSEEIITLDVRGTDLIRVLDIMYENGYTYVVVRQTDAEMWYEIEAHIGETNESNIGD